MNYYLVQPDAAGHWGENTKFTRTLGKMTEVYHLHYEFDGWFGDELLKSSPCFIVTKHLACEIQRIGLTGVEFDDVEISQSEEFDELFPGTKLPDFVWLKVTGKCRHDDFGIGPNISLVISQSALALIEGRVPNARIEAYSG